MTPSSKQNRPGAGWNIDYTNARLPAAFYARLNPVPVRLPDVADMTVTLELRPNTGETVKIVRTGFIGVDDDMLVLLTFNEEFTRGAGGKVV